MKCCTRMNELSIESAIEVAQMCIRAKNLIYDDNEEQD